MGHVFRSRYTGGRSKPAPLRENATASEIANFRFEISDCGDGIGKRKGKCGSLGVGGVFGNGRFVDTGENAGLKPHRYDGWACVRLRWARRILRRPSAWV